MNSSFRLASFGLVNRNSKSFVLGGYFERHARFYVHNVTIRNYGIVKCHKTFLRPEKNVNRICSASFGFLYGSEAPKAAQAKTASELGRDIGPIPDPPPIPSNESLDVLRRAVEENVHDVGVGSYFTPVGWIQNLLDFLHSSTGLPWWEVIVLGTLIIRTATFPIMIYSQRISSSMREYVPEMERLSSRAAAAKRSGDRLQMQMVQMELHHLLQEKHFPVMKRMLIPMASNGVVFACYFLAVRGMATHSLVSMQNEGVLWFTNLTIPDPTMVLPTMCALSTLAVLEMGVESGVGSNQMARNVRWIMRIMPFGVLLVANQLPAAVMCYWFTSNVISLILAILFRMASVRRFLKLPPLPVRAKSAYVGQLSGLQERNVSKTSSDGTEAERRKEDSTSR